MKRAYSILAVVAVLTSATAIPSARATVVGVVDSSNSIPFGSTGGGYYFQQVYSSAAFSGPININEITFYNSMTPGGFAMTGTFDLYLSVTNASISSFDTSPFTFPDSSFTNVFHGTLPALSNARLDFNLSQSISYNPSMGNLVLTVKTFDGAAVGTDSNKWLYLDADKNVGLTNSRFSAFSYDFNQGLVTGFNDAVAVPGPVVGAGLPGLLAGFGALLAWRRSRRALV